jgi:hypothetical protein
VHTHGLRLDVNWSILFTELPLLKRPAAARRVSRIGFIGLGIMGSPMAAARDADVSLPMAGLVAQLGTGRSGGGGVR